jgi:hypothetical protein
MKNNTYLIKNNVLFYVNFCFQVLHITTDPKLWILLLQLFKSSFRASLVLLLYCCRLGNRQLHKVWCKSINVSQNLLYNHLLSEKLSLSTNVPCFLNAGHYIAIYANYNNRLYLKIANTLSIGLNLQSILYLNNWYFRGIANFNNFSLLILHYLICSHKLSISISRPTSNTKSLFLINVKKL